MSASFHPFEATLLDYARGALPPGARLVLAVHLDACAACAADVRGLEAAAGRMLTQLAPAELQPHALEMMLAAIERPAPAKAPRPLEASSAILQGVEVPAALQRARIGRTRWMAPGIRVARLDGAGEGERAYLLRVSPGMKMPDHGHRGRELTLVLKGAFADGSGHYRVGDLVEVDGAVEHQPVIDSGGDCVCLIAAEGVMRMKEWLPRALQPLFNV